MPLFGSHLSIAGGYYKAAEKAAGLGFDTVQIFTKNNNQWRAKPISDEEAALFRSSLDRCGLARAIAHDSYLINLASPDDALWHKSIDAMVVELERAHRLGLGHVVAHPGAHVGLGEAAGLERIVAALDIVLDRTRGITTTVSLETTAGQGTNLGHRFEHLGWILAHTKRSDRLTCCIDSCHVFAAGYPLAPKRKYNETMRLFDKAVGLDRVVAWHLNDSKREQGSRVDRHEHIGRGYLGCEPFEHIVRDRRFRTTPMILETPKVVDPESGRDWDAINLDTLRSLYRGRK